MYAVILLPLAKEDIREAALWYNKKRPGLGKRFTAEIKNEVQHISQNPEGFAIRYDEMRTAILKSFPFMIHFSIDQRKNRVVISAIFHTSRNPNLWRERKGN